MNRIFILLNFLLLVLGQEVKVNYRQKSPWTWTCRDEICVRVQKSALKTGEIGHPAAVCKLNCAKAGVLWPYPQGRFELGKGLVPFYPHNLGFGDFKVNDELTRKRLGQGVEIFKEYLKKMHPDYQESPYSHFNNSNEIINGNLVHVNVHVTRRTEKSVNLENNESYQISIHDDTKTDGGSSTISVVIIAENYYGARHGLETLSQLIAYDDENDCLQIVSQGSINDAPVFSYRGILIDTSRNFFSIESLKRIVDGMSYNKLNILHWHIVDSHSFPFYSKRVPQMTQWGAYDQRKVYTIEQMVDLVEYGRIRGVKILPEFDAPAHQGNGWQWGEAEGKGNLAVCVNKEPWSEFCVEPPCGQLNPINDNVYHYLGEMYRDMLEIFDNDLFHMGGDEVNTNCWNSTKEITDWLKAHGRDLEKKSFLDLWELFQNQAFDKLKEASTNKEIKPIIWTSDLASKEHIKEYLNASDYIIQIWTTGSDPVIKYLLENDYKVIFSNYDAWYLDCGYGAWVGEGNNWCSPYKGWQKVYENSPFKMLRENSTKSHTNQEAEIEFDDAKLEAIDSKDEATTDKSVVVEKEPKCLAEKSMKKGLILGGELALWSEQVDKSAVEGKIWPRASAFAERMWSNPEDGWRAAETRMVHNRQRYAQRGLHPDRLQPEWCHQNEDLCYLNQ